MFRVTTILALSLLSTSAFAEGTTTDADLDGFVAGVDCDDSNPTAYPGAGEIPGDGIDQDCDGGDTPMPNTDASGRVDADYEFYISLDESTMYATTNYYNMWVLFSHGDYVYNVEMMQHGDELDRTSSAFQDHEIVGSIQIQGAAANSEIPFIDEIGFDKTFSLDNIDWDADNSGESAFCMGADEPNNSNDYLYNNNSSAFEFCYQDIRVDWNNSGDDLYISKGSDEGVTHIKHVWTVHFNVDHGSITDETSDSARWVAWYGTDGEWLATTNVADDDTNGEAGSSLITFDGDVTPALGHVELFIGSGTDAMFVDYVEFLEWTTFEGSMEEVAQIGVGGGNGWCLSDDADDADDWSSVLDDGCSNRIGFYVDGTTVQ